jgi:hypothetical protein
LAYDVARSCRRVDRVRVTLHTDFAACARVRKWHTFAVRCAAAIAPGYRVTFVLGVWPAACVFLTPKRSSADATVAKQHWPQHCVQDLISCSPLYGWAIAMRRREFVALIGGALALPPTARAQDVIWRPVLVPERSGRPLRIAAIECWRAVCHPLCRGPRRSER